MANFFIFNGQSSLELGVRIKDKNIFSVPKYDMSLVSVQRYRAVHSQVLEIALTFVKILVKNLEKHPFSEFLFRNRTHFLGI